MEQLAKLLREPKPLPPFPFLKLPLELRLQIWKLSLPLGRAIKVEIDVDRAKAYNRSRLPLSALLHVCQESRRFALTVFRRGFQNTPESRNNFYWSPKLDTIWLYNDLQILTWDFPLEKLQNAPSTIPDLDDIGYILPGVRHLAMQLSAYRHYRVWDWDGSNGTWMPLFLRRFRNLKTVSFLTEDDFVRESYRFYPGLPDEAFLSAPPRCIYGLVYFHSATATSVVEDSMRKYLEKFSRGLSWQLPVIQILTLQFRDWREYASKYRM